MIIPEENIFASQKNGGSSQQLNSQMNKMTFEMQMDQNAAESAKFAKNLNSQNTERSFNAQEVEFNKKMNQKKQALLLEKISKQDCDGLKEFIKHQAIDVNSEINDLGMRPLHIVCSLVSDRCQWMVHIMLEHGADPNIQDVHGRSPIHFAATTGNVAALNYLVRNCNVENGLVKTNNRPTLNLNLQTVGGETALFKALQNLKFDCLSILLQCGADPTIESALNESIFSMAEQYDHPQINLIITEYQLSLKNRFSSNSFDLMQVGEEEATVNSAFQDSNANRTIRNSITSIKDQPNVQIRDSNLQNVQFQRIQNRDKVCSILESDNPFGPSSVENDDQKLRNNQFKQIQPFDYDEEMN